MFVTTVSRSQVCESLPISSELRNKAKYPAGSSAPVAAPTSRDCTSASPSAASSPVSSMVAIASSRDPVISPTSRNRSLPIDCANSWTTEAKYRVAPRSMCFTASTRNPSRSANASHQQYARVRATKRGRRPVVVEPAAAVGDVLEPLEVALDVLGVPVPVDDPAAAGEARRRVQLGGVHRAVRPGRGGGLGCERHEARRGPPARDRVLATVPARVEHRRLVGEHVARVVQDDVEDHPQPRGVRVVDQRAQRVRVAEPGIDSEEVLRGVPVVVARDGPGWRRRLPEHRADPQRGDAEPGEIAQLAAHPRERPAHPAHPGRPPRLRVGVGLHRGVRVTGSPAAASQPATTAPARSRTPSSLAVGEPVDEQEVQHLVRPCRRRRRRGPETGEVQVRDLPRLTGAPCRWVPNSAVSAARCRSSAAGSYVGLSGTANPCAAG